MIGRPTVNSQRGSSLLEVMVALGIMATAYVALMQVQSASIRLSTYGKQLTVATFLAQAMLEEAEEKYIKEGFPDMDFEDSDNFSEQGYPSFIWKLEVLKIELPLGAAFEHMLSASGQGDDQGGLAGSALPGGLSGLGASSQAGLGGLLGKGGGAGGGMLNPDMLRGNIEMLTDMLEKAIREVRLTVTWNEGGLGDQLVLTTHLVQVPQAQGAAGARPENQAGMQPGMKPGMQPGMRPGMQPGMRPGMQPGMSGSTFDAGKRLLGTRK
ncbi:MAG: hypothetical protein JRJ19_09180 [Deltaproteobacteria bacterium]|nr:hypothetical protein [Deltaproteobacteria bacterium]MBW1872225.1 hypothetical protein [Deltaproteobacteria bacterium]